MERGAFLKTLFVYYSDDDTLKELCSKSASPDTDVCELHDISGGSRTKKLLNSMRGEFTRISGGAAADGYDTLIFAFDGRLGVLPAAFNTFLRDNDMRFKKITTLVFGEGRAAKRAGDSLRTRVSLSGGTVDSVVHIPVKQFKNYDEDALRFVRHKLAV